MPTDPLMEEHARAALGATKRLYKRLNELEEAESIGALETSPGSFCDWPALKTLAADANKAIQALRRHALDEATRADVRESILREAMHNELIDREANAARVLDRQRTLLEARASGGLEDVYERAIQSAMQIDAGIASLCPYAPLQRAAGVDQLGRAVAVSSR